MDRGEFLMGLLWTSIGILLFMIAFLMMLYREGSINETVIWATFAILVSSGLNTSVTLQKIEKECKPIESQMKENF